MMHRYRFKNMPSDFPLFYGPGVAMEHISYRDVPDGEYHLGVRGIMGLAWMPKATPFDVYFELVPFFVFLPGFWLDFDGCLGARYYF